MSGEYSTILIQHVDGSYNIKKIIVDCTKDEKLILYNKHLYVYGATKKSIKFFNKIYIDNILVYKSSLLKRLFYYIIYKTRR